MPLILCTYFFFWGQKIISKLSSQKSDQKLAPDTVSAGALKIITFINISIILISPPFQSNKS